MASPFTNVAFAPSSDGVENFACKDKLSGYIFMCNGKTKADCYRYRVFGLPAARLNVVKKIRPCMTLFLFDFELKLLYGVYCATSNGGLGIEPTAFQGKFLAQVRFEIFKDCLPLPESAFKHVIKDNYNAGSKFKQELSNEQVTNLMSLFRPILTIPVPFSNILPEAEVSASYDQYVVKRILNRSGQPSNYHCSQPAHHPCSENDVSVIANHTYASPFDAISATDTSVPAYAQVPSHVSGPSYGNAYASSSSGAAAYWTTEASQSLYQVNSAANQMWSECGSGYACQAASVTKEMLKAYGQVSYQVPASLYEAVYRPTSNEALASWMATTAAPNKLN